MKKDIELLLLLGVPRPKEVVEKMAKSIKSKYDNGWESSVQIEVHQYNKKQVCIFNLLNLQQKQEEF